VTSNGSPSRHAPHIRFHAASGEPFVTYALGLIEEVCGITIDDVHAGELARGVDMYYGRDESVPCRLRIPCLERYGIRTVPGIPTKHPIDAGAPFPFDLFMALRFWLADEGNAHAPAAAFDRHDRLLGQYSAQEAAGVREVPIVNAYLLTLREWIETRVGIRTGRRLPTGKRCGVILSHDVDRPFDPTDLRPVLGQAFSSRDRLPVRAWLGGARAVGQAAFNGIRSPGARRWLFDEVASAEESKGFRSTFFFAATSRFAPGSSWLDVPYDVGSARFRRVFQKLLRHGFHIGLHIGYRAHEAAPQSIAAERERLEHAVGTRIIGSRHHYWHMGRPFWRTLEAHSAAGLRYDSSIAFDETPGYRLGVALPFRLWNPELERPMQTIQLPTMVMDGHLFYRAARTMDGVLAHIERLLDGLKRFEGLAAVDWHQETSFPASGPFRPWGQAYLELLDLLAADREVAVMRYDDVLDHVRPGRVDTSFAATGSTRTTASPTTRPAP
jgi:hypothetical protein